MNKRLFKSTALYSVLVVTTIVVLALASVILPLAKQPTSTHPAETLLTQSANDLKVKDPNSSNNTQTEPTVSGSGSGGASSGGVITLQPTSPSPVTGTGGSVTYPCNKCPEDASSTTDMMVCADYCINPNPEPTPAPTPYPGCNPCHGNTYSASGKMVMCPMIACPLIY